MSWAMLNKFTTEPKRHPSIPIAPIPIDDPEICPAIAKQSWLDNLMQSISDDAKIIVKTIIDGPSEIIEELTPKRKVKTKLYKHLNKKASWDRPRFNHAWREVAECL